MTLSLSSVTVRRGVGPVISDVTLDVRAGEITSVVGPNGAGKTSLLEAISGVLSNVDGRMTMNGQDLRSMSRRRRALSGLRHVQQGRQIFPSLTVRENIRLTARTGSDLDESLALFPELEKRVDSPTSLLSGGEQQMVALAQAFAAKPSYLLLDEMSLGLAPVVFLRLVPTIQQIASRGVGVLLVEQFAHLALAVATDALVITSGHVAYHGKAAPLLENQGMLRDAYMG